MTTKIGQFFNLRPGEWATALPLFLLMGLNMVVLELADVVATAGFISNLGIDQIPWLWFFTTIVTLVMASVYIVLVDRMPRLQLLRWLMGGLAAIYLLFPLFFALGVPSQVIYTLLYLLAEQQWYVLPLAFWALANDLCTMSEGKRIFPLISAGVVLGSVVGNALAAASAVYLSRNSGSTSGLFGLASALMLVGLLVLWLAFRKQTVTARQAQQQQSSLAETIKIGVDYFRNVPILQCMAIIMPLMGLALTFLEFGFLANIDATYSTDLGFQAFYGVYKIVQTLALLLTQWFITGRLLGKVPLKNAFMALPGATVISVGLAFLVPGLIGIATGRFLARLVQRAWDEPARKTLQALIPDERRGRIAAFLDSYFYALATIVGSAFLGFLMWTIEAGWLTSATVQSIYLGAAGVAALGALWAGWRLHKVYDSSLLNWRLSRSRRKSALDNLDF